MYGVKNVGEGEGTLSQYYPEANITEYTEEEALAVAHRYAEKGEEYYGN